MSHDCCHDHLHSGGPSLAKRKRIIIAALVINAAMFAVEMAAGLGSGSMSLQADAIDFLGDAANYATGLVVLGLAPIWGTRLALVKAAAMGGFGLWVIAGTITGALAGAPPEAAVMGAVGVLALIANLACAALLFQFRSGDSNVRSMWLCTRNDVIGNVAVLIAASGVFATASAWPDLVVAFLMAGLAIAAAVRIARQARTELGTSPPVTAGG